MSGVFVRVCVCGLSVRVSLFNLMNQQLCIKIQLITNTSSALTVKKIYMLQDKRKERKKRENKRNTWKKKRIKDEHKKHKNEEEDKRSRSGKRKKEKGPKEE